jgi:hypothetical protein
MGKRPEYPLNIRFAQVAPMCPMQGIAEGLFRAGNTFEAVVAGAEASSPLD